MKKYSWINLLLVAAILATSLVSFFAVGVSAAEITAPVIKAHNKVETAGYEDFVAYGYDTPEEAIAEGMIACAELTLDNNGTTQTGYFRTIAAMCAVSGDKDTNGIKFPTEYQFIVEEISYDSAGDIAFDAGWRSITLKGKEGGTTITAPNGGRFLITAKGTGGFVLENINLKSDASAKATVAQIQANSKLTLNNCTISSTANKSTALVVVQSEASLILNKGTKLVSAETIGKNYYNGGVLVNQTGASVTVNEGVTFDVAGDCIYCQNSANQTVTINGGTFRSDDICIFVGANSTVTVENGTFVSNGARNIVASGSGSDIVINDGEFRGSGSIAITHTDNNGSITINGGTFVNEAAEQEMYGMIIAGSQSLPGGTITVNGGNFYDATGTASAVFRQNASNDDNSAVTVNAANVYGSGTVFAGNVKGGNVAVKPADMLTGAAIRTADNAGIRFQSKIAKSVLEAAKATAYDNTYTVGTLIVPYDYLVDENGNKKCEFTMAALDAANISYLNLVAKDGLNDEGDYYLINAAMTNIREKNYTRDFVAIAYISYCTAEGKTITIYGSYTEKDNVRNIREVAYCALSDVNKIGDMITTADGSSVELTAENFRELGFNMVTAWYEYDRETGVATYVNDGGVAYSRYSSRQREAMEKYIAGQQA